MNVTVFATVGQVAVLKSSFPILLFLVLLLFFLQGEICSSPMWFRHHLIMVIVLRVVFTYCKWRGFFFFPPRSDCCHWLLKKKMLWKITVKSVRSIDRSSDCWKYREVFCLFFVFYAHSHCSVSPQVWPWLCSRSVRFTRNKHFFFLQLHVFFLLCLLPLLVSRKPCFPSLVRVRLRKTASQPEFWAKLELMRQLDLIRPEVSKVRLFSLLVVDLFGLDKNIKMNQLFLN